MSDQAFKANESELFSLIFKYMPHFSSPLVFMWDLKELKPNNVPSRQ